MDNCCGQESDRITCSEHRKDTAPNCRNIVRDLLKESSLSSDDTEFMDLPRPPLPKTVEDLAMNRRSVDVENLDVHPCVAAFLMSRMEYYIGSTLVFNVFSVCFSRPPDHLLYSHRRCWLITSFLCVFFKLVSS